MQLTGRDPQVVEVDTVEPLGALAHGLVATGAHVGEDGLDRGDRAVTDGRRPRQAVAQVEARAAEVESPEHE